MNYGEDELGSFGDENEIKVSPRGFFNLHGMCTSTRFDPNEECSTFSNHH